ncbi:MAG: hypothetical protein ABWX61_07730 [Paenisporosarcina sp.]
MFINFGFSEWVIVFFIMVVIMGVVSIKGVEHDNDDEDINV